MSLNSRQNRFDEICKNFSCNRPDRLIAVVRANSELFQRLRIAIMLYMSQCLPSRNLILNESEILDAFCEQIDSVKNRTPNGQLVPKKHLTMEFNLVTRAFIDIVNELHIDKYIDTWHVPLSIRHKAGGEIPVDMMNRKHASEHFHSDSWIGESSFSITTMIPILGDSERNSVQFITPPSNFQEEWMGPKPSYVDGLDIAAQYKRHDIPYKKGYLYLADFATLHRSVRSADAGPRVSIDTSFAVKRAAGEDEIMHERRVGERADHQVMLEIGTTKIFLFPHDENTIVESSGLKNSAVFSLKDITP